MDHSIILTKCSHPGLRACFPEKGPITVAHGEALAKWCAAGGSPPNSTVLASPSKSPPAAAPKTKLTDAEKLARWQARCIEAGGGSPSYAIEYAVEEGILLDTESLDAWPIAKLPKTPAEVETILTKIKLKAGLIVTEPDKNPVKEPPQ